MGTVQLSPPAAPFSKIKNPGESITINTSGKVLVIPTGNSSYLPSFNEYTLNSNRLTIAESPFGGLKGAGAADYGVGTLYVNSGDGIYLSDKNGNNSTKTLTAGKLKEVSSLTVDTSAKTITEEFIIKNTNSNNAQIPLEDYLHPEVWSFPVGSGTVSVENGKLKIEGTTDGNGQIFIQKTIASTDLSLKQFYKFTLKSTLVGVAYASIGSDANNRVSWSTTKTTMAISANADTNFVLPFKAPVLNSASNPSNLIGAPVWTTVSFIRVGIVYAALNSAITFYVSDLSADVEKSAYVELQTPDNLADTSLQIQAATGSTYATIGSYKLDSVYSAVGTPTSANWVFNDGTKLDDCYPTAPNGRALFPKSISGATVNGSTGTLTYSGNKGTSRRIGLKIDLPPSDSGRTNFNKIRLKTILTYANSGATTYDFEDSLNASYGLQNLVKPFIALYDPAGNYIDFYLFTHRPKNLIRKRDDTGNIYELTLYPGNGSIFRGRITNANLTIDTDSNLIPNCLESTIEGSVTKFLSSYGMVV